MKVLALTGGIGSGKSTARNWFETHGFPTLDADQIGRELVAKNQPGLVEIVKAFGTDLLTETGELDRAALRSRIFSNPTEKQTLESILHPMIRAETETRLQQYRNENVPLVVIEIPLLAETGRPDYIDAVLVMDCSPQTQLARTQARNKLSESDVLAIMQQQASREERNEIADYSVNSDQPRKAMEADLQTVLQNFLTKIE